MKINDWALSNVSCDRIARINERTRIQDLGFYLGIGTYSHAAHFDRCGATVPPSESIIAIRDGFDYICEMAALAKSALADGEYDESAIYMGNALHALQDFFSHSNACELLADGSITRLDMAQLALQLATGCETNTLNIPERVADLLILGCYEYQQDCGCDQDPNRHDPFFEQENKDNCLWFPSGAKDCAMEWAARASATFMRTIETTANADRWAQFAGNGCEVGAFPTVKPIENILSWDPNGKFGPMGTGAGHYIRGDQPLTYEVLFENKAEATAPAQEVVIRDFLDTTLVDIGSLRIGPIFFGDRAVVPPLGVSEYSTDVDLRPDSQIIVRIVVRFDRTTSNLTWRFLSVDPISGLLTDDPLAGFLPPNASPPEGDGSVMFRVMLRPGVSSGTEISNGATIVFDVNPPIETPIWRNIVDDAKPTSEVLSLDPIQQTDVFPVQWAGIDVGSGIVDFSILVSKDNGPFTPWLPSTDGTSDLFQGENGSTYAFYSIASDTAGNVEDAPLTPDAVTTISYTTAIRMSVSAKADMSRVDLEWVSKLDGAVRFRVMRSVQRDGDYRQVGEDIAGDVGMETFTFRDSNVKPATQYFYMIGYAEGDDNSWSYVGPTAVKTRTPVFAIRGVMPNPTQGAVKIDFDIAEAGQVKLEIFDVAGRRVRTVLDRNMDAGSSTARWEGVSETGDRIASGIYFARLQSGKRFLTRKIVIVR